MHDCGCYDPGFILRLLLGDQNGRAVNVWLQNRIQTVVDLPVMLPLSQTDIVWMSETPLPPELKPYISISYESQGALRRMANLDINVKGAQGFKTLLDQFLNLAQEGITLIQLKFDSPATDADAAKIHLTIRLLRAILLKLNSELLLLPDNRRCGMSPVSFLGNTLNEAHLVYSEDLPVELTKTIREKNSVYLNELTARLKLPGLNVAYFNAIPAEDFETSETYLLALSITLALSGVPALFSMPPEVDVKKAAHLMQARARSQAFLPASAQMSINLDATVFAMLKISPDANDLLLCLCNLSDAPYDLNIPSEKMGIPAEAWLDLLSEQTHELTDGQKIHLEPLSTLWLLHSGK